MKNLIIAFLIALSLPALAQKEEWLEVSELNEVNSDSKADAYPWISDDGLRLYFSRENSDGVDQIMYTERKSLHEPFDEPETLPMDHEEGYFSCWLNADETEIYYIVRKSYADLTVSLYKAKRSSRSEEFGKGKLVEIKGKLEGYIAGPSFTEDLSQLFLYNSGDDDNIIMLERKSEYEYRFTQNLPLPSNYETNPGQLARNGLRYYVSLENNGKEEFSEEGKMEHCFYYLERSDLTSSFGDPKFVEGLYNKKFTNLNQPTLNRDESILFFIKSEENVWNNNDIYMAYRTNSEMGKLTIKLSVPANDPSTKSFVIGYSIMGAHNECFLIVENAAGKELKRYAITENVGEIIVPSTDFKDTGAKFYYIYSPYGHSDKFELK